MKCYRPDCDNKLHTGRKYCSNRCAALDRKRATLEQKERPSIPLSLTSAVEKVVGASQASIVLAEVDKYLKDSLIAIPLPLTGQTYGDLVLNYDGTQDYRPSTGLSYDVIEKMLRSGPVIFAMEMKRAQVYRVFSQGRYKVISPDKELAEVAEAALRIILPKMAQDFTWSAFAYGASFQEEVWEWKTKYQLGMVDTPAEAKGTPFLVPKVPNSVNPQTVDHIRRMADGSFNGFAQKRKLEGNAFLSIDPIIVEREQALVIPLNERFRNLWGESILKAIYVDWLWYEIIFRTMVRYMERMATPTTIAKAPSRATVTISGSQTPVKAMDLGLALAGSLSKSNAVAIPSDRDESGNPLWEIAYLTAEERAQPFLQVLEYLAQAMIRDALSADRSITQSSGGVGSYSIGEVHAAASAVTSEMILLQFLHYLNMYFMPEFSLYNRGVDGPPIWLRTQAIDTQERDLLMSLVAVAGNSPAAMELFYLVDWRTLAETSNIPTLSEEELQEFKDKLNKEAEDKMETQQKIMAKNAAPIPTGGASAFGKGNGKTAPKAPSGASNGATSKAEDDESDSTIALENVFTHQIPWMLGEYEARILYEHGVISDEVVRLFNPFHSKADGKFASGKGGGGGGLGIMGSGSSPDKAGVIAGMELKKDVLAKATAKKGFPIKTTGAILGLAGLGLVGVAILSAKKEVVVGPVEGGGGVTDPGNQAELLSEAQQLVERYNALVPPGSQIPKGLTIEQYEQQARADLAAMGIETVFDGQMNVADGDKLATMRDINAGGMLYEGNFYMTPEMAAGLQNGERFPYLVMLHELAHSNQEGFSEITDSMERGFAIISGVDSEATTALLEGQNDLYARMAMSKSTGIPESTDASIHLQQDINEAFNEAQAVYSMLGEEGRSKVAYPEYVDVVTPWNEYLPYNYTYAALVIAAEKRGIGPMEYMNKHHISGATIAGQAMAINEIFPSLASPGVGGIGASIPSQAELNELLQQEGIDGEAAYEELMRRSAAGEF